MRQELRKNNRTILELLEKLGNKSPTEVQVEIVESFLNNFMEEHFLPQKLSPRETSCLLLAAKGKTVQDSAKLMNVKVSTVRTWRNNILGKLGCRSMAQAIFKGIHYGYLCLYPLDNLKVD
ncbi:MAG: LuxR C-terminal-related transcriptional regulator [Rickettsiella sp.]|nr:LuxR C-terminal-related transcriptional regulator [Rickettsiella sp.]